MNAAPPAGPSGLPSLGLGAAWLLAAVRLRRPVLLLAGVLAANAAVYAITAGPLERPYALGTSKDRLMNLATCQVVAAGNSPLATFHVGQPQPWGRPHWVFWASFVALLSGWDPERVFAVYAVLPLACAVGFALALYLGLRGGGADPERSAWEAAFAALFATLLSSQPLDFIGPYRVAWAMNFMLKPNHALGLVLAPLFLWAFGRRGGAARALVSVVLLHLIGWVFILHMAYLEAGLVVFALLSLRAERGARRRDLLDAAIVLGLSGLLGLAYFARFFKGSYLLLPSQEFLPPDAAHLLLGSLRTGWLFWLALWGGFVLLERGDRHGRLLVAQFLTGLLVWLAYLPLSWLQRVHSADEAFYWLRFWTAILAAIGGWDAATMLARRLAPGRLAAPALALGLGVLPFTLPAWWDPGRMDVYYRAGLVPLPEALARTAEWLRASTDPRAVLAADPRVAGSLAALGARRILVSDLNPPADQSERRALLETLVKRADPATVAEAIRRYRVTYLVLTPDLLRRTGVSLEAASTRPTLRPVFFAAGPAGDFIAILALRGRGGR